MLVQNILDIKLICYLDLQNEIQEMQEGMANSDQMLHDFLKNNVVGQLGRFGYTFLRSGLDSLSGKRFESFGNLF